jgi:hypothetical protein
MTMPGLTAESSLYSTTGSYRMTTRISRSLNSVELAFGWTIGNYRMADGFSLNLDPSACGACLKPSTRGMQLYICCYPVRFDLLPEVRSVVQATWKQCDPKIGFHNCLNKVVCTVCDYVSKHFGEQYCNCSGIA